LLDTVEAQISQDEALRRRDRGKETVTEIGHTYNVGPATISRRF
jgi:hypothetical protein